jgi:hypothetical protein
MTFESVLLNYSNIQGIIDLYLKDSSICASDPYISSVQIDPKVSPTVISD